MIRWSVKQFGRAPAPLALTSMLALASAPVRAEEPTMHAGALAHELDRLANTGRVLYVAAHPDDENTRLLAYLANARHVTAAYLSLTRGGGGQNLIGKEQGERLDVLRTEELLAARRIDGAIQRFTRLVDFGYSKTANETLAAWDHEEALHDVVFVIRTFQPDVIITRFDEKPPNHGHHTASAILAREAFEAAADPKRFPEQLERGVEPWRATRLLFNIPSWREGPPPSDALTLDVGDYDARLGLSYGELAAISRSQHKSQGFGVPGERGPLLESFVLVAGRRPEHDILDGVELGIERLGERAAPFARAIDEARSLLRPEAPERALPGLLKAHRALESLPDSPRARAARQRLDHLIAGSAGLFFRATASAPTAVPGSAIKVSVELVMRRPAGMTLARLVFPEVGAINLGVPLGTNERRQIAETITIPETAPISSPYWLTEPTSGARQTVADPRLIGEPESPSPLSVAAEIAIGDRLLRLETPVLHTWTDPVHGERTRRFMVVPPATVTPTREAVMIRRGHKGEIHLRVRAATSDLVGEVSLPLPSGWTADPKAAPITLARAGEELTVRFDVTPPTDADAIEIGPVFTARGRSWSFREDVIDHAHIPFQLLLTQPVLRLVPVALELPKGTIGYVPGSGDTTADDLRSVGAKVETIDDERLESGDLGRYAAILIGIRAYNTRPSVRRAHTRLMTYAEHGGVVVVQYNTNSRIGPLEGSIGPYPLEIGRGRITDETALMQPLDPRHPMLREPNLLGPADGEGWVQERGLYFAEKWDARYQSLFSMSDPGEEPLLGAVLVAKYGRGRYVYTGLSFFRQLPAGVPGAYRLLANLLARK